MTTIPGFAPGTPQRIQRILFSPRSEWRTLAEEETAATEIWLRWVIPLAAIGPIASVLGALLFGFLPFSGLLGWSLGIVIRTAVVTYVANLLGIAFFTWLLQQIVPRFGGTVDALGALKITAYSATAAWVIAVVQLVPPLAPLGILGIYGLYLLYVGLEVVAGVPKDRLVACEATLIVVGVAVGILFSLVVPGM